jgi:hypothetical protein
MSLSGKSRDECIQALRAAQNIPDLAFEFLMSGHIPQMGAGEQQDYGDEEMDEQADMGGLPNMNIDPQAMQGIQALINNPSFPMIRQRMI